MHQPILIWPEFQGLQDLRPGDAQKLKDAVKISVAVLQKYYGVRHPPPTPLRVPALCLDWVNATTCSRYTPDLLGADASAAPKSGLCGKAVVNASHIAPYTQCKGGKCSNFTGGPGVPADYVLYVTAVQDDDGGCNADTVAWAMPCLYDILTNRPLMGTVNVCPGGLPAAAMDRMVHTITHEMHHALGFTSSSYDLLIDAQGNPIPRDQVLRAVPDAYDPIGARQTLLLATPTVAARAREHFGCASLQGAALEDEGDEGSAGSHFEYLHYQGELMVATDPCSLDGSQSTVSPITLAFMQDSGWYTVNWTSAGALSWGHRAGCEFASSNCTAYMAANPSQPWFCTPQEERAAAGRDGSDTSVCAANGGAMVFCKQRHFANNCPMKVAYSLTQNCETHDQLLPHSDVFGWQQSSSARCIPFSWPLKTQGGKMFGEDVKQDDSACFAASCTPGGELQVFIFGATLLCPTGGTIDLAAALPDKYRKGLLGPCPDNALMCGSLSCDSSCATGGLCRAGKCHCTLQYAGPQCAQQLAPGDALMPPAAEVATAPPAPVAAPPPYVLLQFACNNTGKQVLRSGGALLLAVTQLTGVVLGRVDLLSLPEDAEGGAGGEVASSLVLSMAKSLVRRSTWRPQGLRSTRTAAGSRAGGGSNLDAAGKGSGGARAKAWAPMQEATKESVMVPILVQGRRLLGNSSSAAAPAAGAASARAVAQTQPGAPSSEPLQLTVRVITLGDADAAAIAARVSDSQRQSVFGAALQDAGLQLLPGTVQVVGPPPAAAPDTAPVVPPFATVVPASSDQHQGLDPSRLHSVIIACAAVAGVLLLALIAGVVWTIASRRHASPGKGGSVVQRLHHVHGSSITGVVAADDAAAASQASVNCASAHKLVPAASPLPVAA